MTYTTELIIDTIANTIVLLIVFRLIYRLKKDYKITLDIYRDTIAEHESTILTLHKGIHELQNQNRDLILRNMELERKNNNTFINPN